MEIKSYHRYIDPSHSWLKVLRSHIEKLGIIDKISSYSYQKGNFVYLEEDCDASLFISTLEKTGVKVRIYDNYSDRSSRIRNYDSFYINT